MKVDKWYVNTKHWKKDISKETLIFIQKQTQNSSKVNNF